MMIDDSVKARFWSKVDVRGPDDCWEWKGRPTKYGYGVLGVGPKVRRAHRVSWVIEHGSLSDEDHVLHRCDNRICVNPRHLWLGDNAANVADRVAKGRSGTVDSELHHAAKLTRSDVRRMRSLIEQGYRQVDLADQFNVSQATVSRVKRRAIWKDE